MPRMEISNMEAQPISFVLPASMKVLLKVIPVIVERPNEGS
jgi:hypothetical protein